ncbi:sensor histidine kinase [Clostridium kluyveri]|uniref:sensor histidine kinase n=1 Tax=Clostridium kluyveri TaxID=1534 RepID=UPI0022450AD2|nr:sensor histidine kinase [Clostridium kluyveri]UZQ51406.1 sensor histidine kinase [Clostridium kluyveri]
MLRKLCRTYTNLSQEDIEILENMEKYLQSVSNLVKADIFIDCLTRESGTAIVVSEAKPSNSISLYMGTVVGELALMENEPAALRTLQIGMGTSDLKAITQENKVVKQNTVPIKNSEDKVIGVLIMEKDITEDLSKNRNMEILSETTEQLSQTLMNLKSPELSDTVDFNLINDAIIIFNQYGISIYANHIAEDIYIKLGYKDKIVGMKFDNLVLSKTSFCKILKENNSILSEVSIGNFSLQIKYAVLKKNNSICGVVMLIKDITDIKEKEKQLILKAVAIREIHHRVKNNLQTIASILRLQSRRINNEEAKKAFKESIGRILSIAATHEVLAQNGIDDVDIKNILSKIKDNAIRNFIQCNKQIDIKFIGDSFYVDSDKATSIAIVLNELLQNSLQHAFVDKNEGFIEIIIKKGIMYSNISVIDGGKGFDINLVKNESLGLDIVKSIVKDKLNGDINIDSSKSGTKAVFWFEN